MGKPSKCEGTCGVIFATSTQAGEETLLKGVPDAGRFAASGGGRPKQDEVAWGAGAMIALRSLQMLATSDHRTLEPGRRSNDRDLEHGRRGDTPDMERPVKSSRFRRMGPGAG